MEGSSLVPFFDSTEIESRTLFWEHEGNRAVREGDWKLVGGRDGPWELYDMGRDRTELNDLASVNPEKLDALKSKWDSWAEKVSVLTPEELDAARKSFKDKLREEKKREK